MAGQRARAGFSVEAMPRREVKNEESIEESSHTAGQDTPSCRKKPGGWRGWGALDAKINAEQFTWRTVERGVCGREGHGAIWDGRRGEGRRSGKKASVSHIQRIAPNPPTSRNPSDNRRKGVT